MRSNKLVISINKPVHEIFSFTITPPNSKYWIPDIINEETNELPIKIGTIYKLTTKTGETFEVVVSKFDQDKLIEWTSKDQNFHCRYTYIPIDANTSKLEYFEWVDKEALDEPFSIMILKKLKSVVENL
jgi:hypothetical protein